MSQAAFHALGDHLRVADVDEQKCSAVQVALVVVLRRGTRTAVRLVVTLVVPNLFTRMTLPTKLWRTHDRRWKSSGVLL